MSNLSPIPITSSMIDTEINSNSTTELQTSVISNTWFKYFLQMQDRAENTPYAVGTVFDTLTDQTAAIAATKVTISTPTGFTTNLSKGLYRVSTYARITQAASTSSSLTITLGWTDGTVACTSSGSAMTGNTTSTTQSLSAMIRSDSSTPLTYSAAYASSGGTAMTFRLDLAVEQIPT